MTVRRSVGRFLAAYRWYLLAAGSAATLVLGYIGWWQYLTNPRPLDVGYWTLKLFLGASPPMNVRLPPALDIARFLAPVVTGWAGFSGLAALFRGRVQQMRIPLMRGHVVICGLGYVGTVFLRHLREAKAQVVVIESNPANPSIEMCRSLGVPVIVGDAQQARTLQAAGVEHAARLLSVCPHDAVNAEVVAIARQTASGRPRSALACLAQIADPELCALLRFRESRHAGSVSALDFFNTDEISSRLLLDEFPVATASDRPHILVADLDILGSWVVYHAARDWYERRVDATTPLVVTVVDNQAEQRVQSLLSRYPALENACKFISLPATVGEIHRLPKHHADAAAPPLTHAYVTAYRDEQAVQMALRLRPELDSAVPLVVALARAYGVARLLGDAGSVGGSKIDVFPTLERSCTVELIRGGSYEAVAHAIHQRWRTEQLASGKPAPAWSEADESLRESSRAQARHIAVKLPGVGCDVTPLRDWDASEFTFSDDELENLARAEHDRWNAERIAGGWTLGDKDVERKKTPYLVPFDDLPDDIAEYDRMFVREIPALLASVGLQLIRVQRNGNADQPGGTQDAGKPGAYI